MSPEEVQDGLDQKKRLASLERRVSDLEGNTGAKVVALAPTDLTLEAWAKLSAEGRATQLPTDWHGLNQDQWDNLLTEDQRNGLVREQYLNMTADQRARISVEDWNKLNFQQRYLFISPAATTSEEVADEQKGNPKTSVGDLAPSGPSAPSGPAEVTDKAAEIEKVNEMTVPDLKAYADEHEIELPAGAAKPEIVAAIIKAIKKS